ncbi:hypothetical protein [Polaromonas sp. JS666]|uniref:hypothetical protein n=1 Tax=Polaromonas sp. (strain JS666 / ATCC BAA-500) TaxID=296591 RepID=UPI000053319F|nr:hypothetical protein Bpro_0345 [Polaromonas sp. JS666]
MNRVDANEARSALRAWRAPYADWVDHRTGLGQAHALALVGLAAAQVVQVRHRQAGQALEAAVAMRQCPLEQVHGGRARQRAVGAVHLGQQQGISRGVAPRKHMSRAAVALVQALAVQHACQQPGELGARVAAGVPQIAQHHAFIGPIQAGIAQELGHRDDVGVARLIAVGHAKAHLQCAGQEGLKLGGCLQTGFVHVDHHAKNDRPNPAAQAHTSLDKTCR